jgi:hypothetical protein
LKTAALERLSDRVPIPEHYTQEIAAHELFRTTFNRQAELSLPGSDLYRL